MGFKVGAEVGIHQGEYSELILRNWEPEEFYLIDDWDAKRFTLDHNLVNMNKAIRRTEAYHPKLLRMKSVEASKLFPDNYFDFIFIDAGHSYEDVLEDLKAWYPKVKEGGIFSGHDYWDGQMKPQGTVYGVKSAVDSLFKVQVTEDEFPSWYFKK